MLAPAGGVVGLWRLLVFLFALVADESVGGVGSELGLERANGGDTLDPADSGSAGWQGAVVHPSRWPALWS